jgi:hypothetical protein
LAACQLTNRIFTRFYQGHLVAFDPITRVGELVDEINPEGNHTGSYLYFAPNKPELLYIAYEDNHTIWTYNTLTKEHLLLAGTVNAPGWVDGDVAESRFRQPSQLIVTEEGVVYVADRGNHCIRIITPDGRVTTIIGKGGTSGYQDGNPDDALFDNPRGIAINKDGDMYIADFGNNAVRKLAIQ